MCEGLQLWKGEKKNQKKELKHLRLKEIFTQNFENYI